MSDPALPEAALAWAALEDVYEVDLFLLYGLPKGLAALHT